MAFNSLRQYNNGLTTAGNEANNFSRPNLNPNNGGLLQATNVGNVLNGSSNVNFSRQYTTDSILSGMGNTSTNIGGSGFLNAMTNISSFIMQVLTLGVTAYTAKKMFSSNKSSNSGSNQQAADQNLSSLTETAGEYDKKSDFNSMQNTAKNLQTAVKTATTRLNNAKRGAVEAETKITNLDKDKAGFAQQLETFNTEKDSITTNLEQHKGSLSQLEAIPSEERTPEQTAQIEELKKVIAEEENALKTTYSTEKQQTLENQIIRVDDEINSWREKANNYKNEMKQLPDEIRDAQKALEKLNKKIEKKVS